MRDRPTGLREHDLRLALAEGWRIDVAALRYAPVGGGSYHWVVRDGAGRRWFVTVDDLDDKAWLGDTPGPRSWRAWRRRWKPRWRLPRRRPRLRRGPGSGVPARRLVRPVGPRYAVAVFPFLDGSCGALRREPLPAAERAVLTDMLAALHQAGRRPAAARVAAIGLAAARGAGGGPAASWDGPGGRGRSASPRARCWPARGRRVRELLEVFDRLAAARPRADEFVITHGEPHPGNVLRAGAGGC